ncbi:hypothetical protein PAPYR_9409 [Paratrimastix pyriformis]|uniref:Secreted protein n=1 Tax=Paratrimastix pyriformis TaxID=342808 RepID=A0ABQ8UB95_9EUKA|nr:hypothetical protein PAPYR_9409 [Paratrimastix pyriformis]
MFTLVGWLIFASSLSPTVVLVSVPQQVIFGKLDTMDEQDRKLSPHCIFRLKGVILPCYWQTLTDDLVSTLFRHRLTYALA